MTLEQFTTELKYVRNVSPKTLRLYGWTFKAFEGALDGRDSVVQRVGKLRERGVQPVTINTYLRCLNAYFRWLHTEHGQALLKLPKLKEERKVLATFTIQHTRAILNHRPKGTNLTRAWMVALAILDSGLRINEALSLRITDLDFENLLVRVKGKGGKERLVPMSVELRKRLFGYVRKRRDGPVFGTRCGTAVTSRNLQRDLKELCKQLGITGVRTSPHTLRHTFAVGYLRNGGNLYYLSRILGHSSVKTTERYLQSLGVDDLKAVHEKFSLLAAGH